MPKTKQSSVPRETQPIDWLLEHGWRLIDLANAWDLNTTDAVYKLRRYEYVPRIKTAKLMAKTFGWSLGDVIEHWAGRAPATPSEERAAR